MPASYPAVLENQTKAVASSLWLDHPAKGRTL
jgi:hypothetical protein